MKSEHSVAIFAGSFVFIVGLISFYVGFYYSRHYSTGTAEYFQAKYEKAKQEIIDKRKVSNEILDNSEKLIRKNISLSQENIKLRQLLDKNGIKY